MDRAQPCWRTSCRWRRWAVMISEARAARGRGPMSGGPIQYRCRVQAYSWRGSRRYTRPPGWAASQRGQPGWGHSAATARLMRIAQLGERGGQGCGAARSARRRPRAFGGRREPAAGMVTRFHSWSPSRQLRAAGLRR